MSKVIDAKAIPKTLTNDLLDLVPGKALMIERKRQAQAMSIISYYRQKPEYKTRIYRSKKKDNKHCYIIREA